MATIRLRRAEAEDGDLPSVCLRCGAPATLFKSKKFAWQPSWIFVLLLAGLLPFIIVSLILTKRLRLRGPLCAAHQNHWSARTLAIWLCFGAILALGVVAIVALEEQNRRPGGPAPLEGALCGGSVVALLAWLVLVAILQMTAIRTTKITDRGITLIGVSRGFADALDDWRYREDEAEHERRPRRASRASEDYVEDDRPRRRPLPPDAFEDRER